MAEFRLPDLGEGLEEAEVVTWLVGVGDRVEIDQNVVEVETAKAAVEVPVPFAGIVSALHADPGTTVAVGTPLISVTTDDEAARQPFREPGVVTASPGELATDGAGHVEAQVEGASGNVLIGYGTTLAPRRSRRGPRRGAAVPPAVHAAVRQPWEAGAVDEAGPVAVISPLVRRMARERGLDLRRVAGSGPRGVVRRCDVEAALAALAPDVIREVTPQPEAVSGAAAAATTRIPLRGLRKAVADKLSRSRREIPEATVWVDVDATALLDARAVLNAAMPERAVSVLALLARFAVLALRRFPELNARIDGDEIVLHDHVHLGFAAQTDRGLLVPVIHHADALTTRQLSAALGERTAAARAGVLSPADLTGGTFTVNNYGVFGVDGSAAIINHPEVAILGLGRIIDRPWVVDGRIEVRKVSQLTLAFDHRVCDGGAAGGFLRLIADCVESPVTALGEL